MKKAVLYVVIFIAFFSTSLIAGLPISWVLQQVPTVKGLDIQGAQGTVWQGSASNVRWQRQNLGEVNWDFQLSGLFTGKAEFAVRFGRGSDMDVRGRGLVGYSLTSGPYAENLVASFPAAKVVEQARLPVPVGVVIADLNCKDSVLSASGEQKSKQVSAAFSAELMPNQRYSTKAWFKPGAEFPSGMSDQLKWLGNPNAQGQYEFDYKGRF